MLVAPFLLIFLLFCSPLDTLLKVSNTLPPVFIAIFVVNFKKAKFNAERFVQDYNRIGREVKLVMSLAVMVAFIVMVSAVERGGDAAPDLTPFFLQTLAATLAVALLDVVG